MNKKPSSWSCLESERMSDCRVFEVFKNRCQRTSDQKESDYFVIQSADFVNVVALTPEKKMVLVRQFRHGKEGYSWEVPGGLVDPGESPLKAGVRELKEETGYEGSSAQVYANCSPNPAIMSNTCHFVVVENVILSGSCSWDENEEIEVTLLPLSDVWQWCREGRIHHSLTLAALWHYALRSDSGQMAGDHSIIVGC